MEILDDAKDDNQMRRFEERVISLTNEIHKAYDEDLVQFMEWMGAIPKISYLKERTKIDDGENKYSLVKKSYVPKQDISIIGKSVFLLSL
jgi:hypothetical protein